MIPGRPQQRILAGLGLLLLALHFSGFQDALAYQRDLVERGELWRLWTGNLVHIDTTHLLLNLAGLAVVALFCCGRLTGTGLFVALLFLMPAVTMGIYLRDPGVGWYMGLSGVLHGLLVLFLARGLATQPRFNGVLLAVLFLKLAWEWRFGSLGGGLLLDFPVVTSAHAYGALGGAVLALWHEVDDWLRLREEA